MKIPPAPVPSKAWVSTILSFGSFATSVIGTEIDLFDTCATRTFEIYIEGGSDVETDLRFKNPELTKK